MSQPSLEPFIQRPSPFKQFAWTIAILLGLGLLAKVALMVGLYVFG